MPIRCPTCSRVNPSTAAYCYYDGRGLNAAALAGPVGLGTLPFPLPFSFSDGHGCSNFNQLVLACDRHWNEARGYLLNGTWRSFFSAIGRADLAALAAQAAAHGDADTGLCRLLEGLPADPEALRPPKLALPAVTEDLGALESGKDSKFNLVIENQGLLLLCGSVMTECDWLSFGDRQGNASVKLFQTRNTCTLSVRVLGSKLRAGKQPLEGTIVVETNGGRQTVAVRAMVPVRPFPGGQPANAVLAGAASPREIALKAKARPREAAVLFEQGAVKTWYESNGWTYPVRGTQARGRSGLQQFFEALGLTKPPRLEINTERIVCQGEAGKHLIKKVVLRTAEQKNVHAEGLSDQDWIKVLPAVPQGNSVTVPLRIDVPPRPGETLNGVVTFLGNGQQRFVVPVALTVVAQTEAPQEEPADSGRWLHWVAAAALLLCLGIGVVLFAKMRRSHAEDPPPDEVANGTVQPGQGNSVPPVPQPPPPDTGAPAPKVEHWWDKVPGTNLSADVAELKKSAGENRPIFEKIEGTSQIERRKGYEQLAAKLAELARDSAARQPLGRFVAECCVYEPSELNVSPLLRGLARQLPAEDTPFSPGDVGEEVERASFWLGVVCDVIANKAVSPDRRRGLAGDLETVFGTTLDLTLPPNEFKDQAEKLLAEQCYRNLLPTAEKSIEQALAARQVLLARFRRHLKAEFRDQEDVKLLALGLSGGKEPWPKLEPLARTCVESSAVPIGFKLVDLYEKADEELAAKLQGLLAVRWKAAANPKLTQAARAAAIRKSMAAAQVPYAQRAGQLQELLAKSPLSARPAGPPRTTPLQDAMRLNHAATMACILFRKEAADVERFDDLVARVPGREPEKPSEPEKVEDPPRPTGDKEIIDPAAGNRVVREQLTDKNDLDPRRGTYRKVYPLRLRGGEIYVLDMGSTDLKPYLRLESVAGVRLADDRGANAHIVYRPSADGVYNLVASSMDKKAVGAYTLQIARQQIMRFGFLGPLGPLGPPGPSTPTPTAVEEKAPPVKLSDLADLANQQSEVRMAAFKNLAGSLPNDLPYRHAQKIAAYLLVTAWEPLDAELEAATGLLPPLSRCRRLLEALADAIATGDKLAQRRTEAIVGSLLGQRLRFDRDEDWRSACRKLLLQRALDLTGRPSNEADRAADTLRDLYKEQSLAFGLEAPDIQEQTRLTPVLERLIEHVAAAAAGGKVSPADKAFLEQVGRQVQAARFAAENDLEYAVLLQRLWIKVLVLALQEQVPDKTRKAMLGVQRGLENKDREAANLLEQLRSGEESLLRVWALADDLKVQ